MLEMLLPQYTRQLLENYQSIFIQLASQLRWLYFDDAFRLVARVGWLDDGWIRLRLDGQWEFTGELLRELSWVLYGVAEMDRNVDMLKNALESVGADKVRVAVVDALPRSPFYLTDGAGAELSDYVKNIDIALTALRDAILSKLDELGKLVPLDYTTTPLGAGASWTSAVDSDPTTGYIVGSVYADQAGTLYIEQSPNSTNWDVVDSFPVSAGNGFGFTVEKVCPYTRVRYVNGTTSQTVFRLYVFKRLRVVIA